MEIFMLSDENFRAVYPLTLRIAICKMLNLFTWRKRDGTELSFGLPAAMVLIVLVVLWAGKAELLPAILHALHFH